MVMYMVMCLLTDTEFEKVRDFREYANHKLVHEKLLTLRYLKKANPEAYAYAVSYTHLDVYKRQTLWLWLYYRI